MSSWMVPADECSSARAVHSACKMCNVRALHIRILDWLARIEWW